MKNLQAVILKIIISFLFFCSLGQTYAQFKNTSAADSLFHAKHYTESMELFKTVFNERKYTPAMLLKMAYIQEGLGKIGATLYYLKLYYLASGDEQALSKMEELATKFRLSGYVANEADHVRLLFNKHLSLVKNSLVVLVLLALLSMILLRRRNKKSLALVFVVFLMSATILYINNFYAINSVIVSQDQTYLMDGPSAGAPVVGIVDEGNQLALMGQKDVWLKVKWMDKVVYVKKNSVWTVSL